MMSLTNGQFGLAIVEAAMVAALVYGMLSLQRMLRRAPVPVRVKQRIRRR